ncbi:hypothetical protein [Protaetiibacter mangrovi]|uniref:Transcriptional regulator, AbiEi antitoxin, Type IV TA system n=1 Tax=Protaetiibacter mangrovi TaxID=2970926 RepID=A0ABT1ZFM7_9MICO|nr:hypothetical protein [Protaetiibacter mangrovi]MCS0499506.1 hypothetical protein [Protaetiibacter mangrovi]TPW99110.1 hypothetical protein FJ656_33245 [Schumannella luteola]
MDETVITSPWREEFVLAREAPESEADRIAARVRTGELLRLVRGVYIPAARWEPMSVRERHLTLARAVVLMRERRLVLSHRTAATAWGLPLLGDPPDDVHVIALRAGGGRSDDRLVRHCLDIPRDTVVLDGLEVTTLARTAVDVARTSRFAEGVMVADAVLARGIPREALVDGLPEPGYRGARRAREVVAFADARSGSPLESLSRVSIAEAGLPAPELQHEFHDRDGLMMVDFWWPRFGAVGEFDGKVKYLDERYRDGRTLEQVLLDEKWREQRLRRQRGVRSVARWDAATAASPARLGRLLSQHGIR